MMNDYEYHSESLHIAIGEGQQSRSGNIHWRLFDFWFLGLIRFKFRPKVLVWERCTCGPIKNSEHIER